MDYSKEERDHKRNQEVKYFAIITFTLLTLFIIFVKLGSIVSYSDEVILAEAPSNVGGNNAGNNESFIINISNDRSDESLQPLTPSVIYVPDTSGGADDVRANDTDGGNPDNSDETNESSDVIYKDSGHNNAETEQSSEELQVTATNGDEIYVPDSDDDCPVSDLVPLPTDVQEYIWNHCKKVTGDYKNYYAFILGAIQLESEFKRTAIHHNSNGSTDRGLMQINSCNIKECKRAGLITCTDDLWDIYKNIDCGFHEMNDYIRKFGVCESAYFAYNTGRTSGGSNKNSRVVMSNMAQWNTRLFG